MLNIIQILVLIAGFAAVCYCITRKPTIPCNHTDITQTQQFTPPEPSRDIPAIIYTPDAELQAEQDAEDLLKRINQAPIVRV